MKPSASWRSKSCRWKGRRCAIKTLSLTQPFASLVALGEKRIETRSWSTTHRGILAIHAAKAIPRHERELCYTPPFVSVLRRHDLRVSQLPRGAIVAVAVLRHILPTGQAGRFWVDDLPEQERAFGNYTAGRYGWFLYTIRALREPIPARGKLGLWEWSPPANLEELLLPAAPGATVQPGQAGRQVRLA